MIVSSSPWWFRFPSLLSSHRKTEFIPFLCPGPRVPVRETQPTYQYVWSRRYIDAPVLRDKNTDAAGLCDDERIYYLGDANFNITTLVNTGGDAVERYVYTPYGVLTVCDATWANIRSTSSYANAYTYTGRQLDAETGLYYYRARFYASQLGRFCSRDPIGYRDHDLNVFGYSGNDPTTYVDPRGTDRYITNWSNALTIHVGVAVDVWECLEGKWIKTGVKTFNFSVSSYVGILPSLIVWWGKVDPSDGLNLFDPIRMPSTPCEDRAMLEYCETQVKDPSYYSIFHNCMFWSVNAVNVGMGAKCECCDEDEFQKKLPRPGGGPGPDEPPAPF